MRLLHPSLTLMSGEPLRSILVKWTRCKLEISHYQMQQMHMSTALLVVQRIVRLQAKCIKNFQDLG